MIIAGCIIKRYEDSLHGSSFKDKTHSFIITWLFNNFYPPHTVPEAGNILKNK